MPKRFDDTTLSAVQIAESAARVTERLGGIVPDVGIIAGSGMTFGDFDVSVRIPYGYIPHLPEPGVVGHTGEFVLAESGGKNALVARGRLHRYEGHSWDTITLPVRIFAELGCKYVILTAAVGAVNPDIATGDIVVIEDHINLMWDSPIAGFADPELGDRFVNLHSVYDNALIESALDEAASLNLKCRSGVYAAVPGPNFEPPAEVRMIAMLGGDVVGMSVVPEVIVAAQCGFPALGLCAVSNRAGEPGDHAEVVKRVEDAEENVVRLIEAVLQDLG
ncbi:MAG: purine-nucleoside phosphorylase [bacterium]|nr:purine-nucleoside phosphorylase [bacterium]